MASARDPKNDGFPRYANGANCNDRYSGSCCSCFPRSRVWLGRRNLGVVGGPGWVENGWGEGLGLRQGWNGVLVERTGLEA